MANRETIVSLTCNSNTQINTVTHRVAYFGSFSYSDADSDSTFLFQFISGVHKRSHTLLGLRRSRFQENEATPLTVYGP